MRRYWIIAASVALFVIITFSLVGVLNVPLLTDPTEWMMQNTFWAGVVGGILLIADVLIPIPSSIIMIAHGAILGVIPGFMVSYFSTVAGSMLGWLIGSYCQDWASKKVSDSDRQKAERLFQRYGVTAIIITRSLPILSETMAIMAGVTNIKPSAMLIASLLGCAPAALVYAIVGSKAADFQSGAVVAICVFVLAAISWIISCWMVRNQPTVESE